MFTFASKISDMKNLQLYFSTLLLTVLFCACSHSGLPPKIEQSLDSLDLAITQSAKVAHQRLVNAESLGEKARVLRTSEAYTAAAEAYACVSNDSMIMMYHNAIESAQNRGDASAARRLSIKFAGRLGRSMLTSHAVAVLDSISYEELTPADRYIYWSTRTSLLLDGLRAQTLEPIREQYAKASIRAVDSILKYSEPESPHRLIVEGIRYYMCGDRAMAVGCLTQAVDDLDKSDVLFPDAAMFLADIYKDTPAEYNEHLFYLINAATADARRANCESLALLNLGAEFYRHGNLSRAYKYLSTAALAAEQSDVKDLYDDIAPVMTALVNTMQQRDKSRERLMTILIIALIVIVVMIFFARTAVVHRDALRIDDINRLSKSVATRDRYISRLLDLCSVYVEGLEEFNRLVDRKLKANQYQDLYRLVESGKIIQDQTGRFFDVFDGAVLNIYPDFVSEVNSLLLPDKQIPNPGTGTLTPELRILAFMRMGVTDSNRLSKFLGLSLNTIYTYRNRIKSRAINREKFEQDFLSLNKPA